MSNVGVYGFDIPHEFVKPTRDMVIIRIPFPPEKIGSILVAQATRELLAHNVQAGRIVAMGPLAFQYKDGDGIARQPVEIGDWVLIRPYAGTMIQGGQVMVTSGWRYVSSFADVIGLVPADKMPDPKSLVWEEKNVHDEPPKAKAAADAFAEGVRERTTYAPGAM